MNSIETLQKSVVERACCVTLRQSRLPWYILRKVSEYIAANLAEPLSVCRLASQAGLSATQFSRCFRNSTGISPHAYVMRQRLCEAEFLLVMTKLQLTEVALRTGFSDQSHFTRRFLQGTGLTPRKFRSLYR